MSDLPIVTHLTMTVGGSARVQSPGIWPKSSSHRQCFTVGETAGYLAWHFYHLGWDLGPQCPHLPWGREEQMTLETKARYPFPLPCPSEATLRCSRTIFGLIAMEQSCYSGTQGLEGRVGNKTSPGPRLPLCVPHSCLHTLGWPWLRGSTALAQHQVAKSIQGMPPSALQDAPRASRGGLRCRKICARLLQSWSFSLPGLCEKASWASPSASRLRPRTEPWR